MSGSLRVARTADLVVLRALGQLFSMVAVQLLKYVQKLDEEETLTRSDGLSYNLANLDDLIIGRCCKNIIPNGLAKMVLPSQLSFLSKNFRKISGQLTR